MSADFNTLTSKQKKVLAAIESYINLKGIPPTVREIGETMGEKTPGAVQGILNRLEQKGVIKREVGMARSIQLVNDNSKYLKPLYIPELKKISKRNAGDLFNVYNIKKYHPISPEAISVSNNCFMISCPDNSLFESGIKYEDTLFLSKEEALKDGDIVMILYGEHVLLRKYFSHKDPNVITLKADSNLLDKELFSKDSITVIGKLIGKVTRF